MVLNVCVGVESLSVAVRETAVVGEVEFGDVVGRFVERRRRAVGSVNTRDFCRRAFFLKHSARLLFS